MAPLEYLTEYTDDVRGGRVRLCGPQRYTTRMPFAYTTSGTRTYSESNLSYFDNVVPVPFIITARHYHGQ